MKQDVSRSVLRIHGIADGQFAGVGFLLGPNLLITTTYIINIALGRDTRELGSPSVDILPVSSPFTTSTQTADAKVDSWCPDDQLAALRLSSNAPPSATPVELGQESDLWGHSFRAYGFPRESDVGLWVGGVIRGPLARDGIQLQIDGEDANPGFGGCPIFDNVSKRTVGLFFSVLRPSTGFMIPAATIAKCAGMTTLPEAERTPVQVFLCHASQDKLVVRQLYTRLLEDGFNPWFDEEDLVPGQKWEDEIRKAVRRSDAIVVCLSSNSTSKTGFVQKEIRMALDVAEEKPDGHIYVLPLRLEECTVPDRLQSLQWVDLFQERGWDRLKSALAIVQNQA